MPSLINSNYTASFSAANGFPVYVHSYGSGKACGDAIAESKANNIAGLQLADLIAHPSRNKVLYEHQLLYTKLAPFAQSVIKILRVKYDRQFNKVFGEKFI